MMLQPLGGGSRFNVNHNFGQVVDQIGTVATEVVEARPLALTAMGRRLLSWGYQDFRKKSEGGSAGGETWKPITDMAIWTRVRGTTGFGKAQDQAVALYRQPPVPEELQKRLPRGKGAAFERMRAAIIYQYMKDHPDYARAVAASQKKRAAIRKRKQAMFDREKSGAKIGVDTGRLANGLQYGDPGSIFEVSTQRLDVTVGATAIDPGTRRNRKGGVDYAPHFDEERQIFGERFIDQARHDELQDTVHRVFERVIKEGLK